MDIKKIFIPFMVVSVPFMGLVMYKNTLGNEPDKPEPWLYAMMPDYMEGAAMRQSMEDKISYRMDESTYKTLSPIGIACQVWQTSEGDFDVVVIAGTSMKSFHDQQICFKAQGWNIRELRTRVLETESHGAIPFTVMELDRKDNNIRYGIYAFRAPTGFASHGKADYGFMINEIQTGRPGVGYSYRFIGMSDGISEDELFDFAKRYLETAKDASGGIL